MDATKYTLDTLPGRLRIKAGMISMGERIEWGSDSNIMWEAATKIETLEKRIKELEGTATNRTEYPKHICSDAINPPSLFYAGYPFAWCQGCNPGNCSGCNR